MKTKRTKSDHQKRTIAALEEAHFTAVYDRLLNEPYFDISPDLPEEWANDPTPILEPAANEWVN